MNRYWLDAVIFAIVLIAVLRFYGSIVLRIQYPRWLMQLYGWILCTLSAWIAVAIIGVWLPLWIPLLIAPVIALLAHSSTSPRHHAVWNGIIVTVLCIISHFPYSLINAVGLCFLYACLGFVIDCLTDTLPKNISRFFAFISSEHDGVISKRSMQLVKFSGIAVLPLLIIAGVNLHRPFKYKLARIELTSFLHFGIAIPNAGKKVVLQDSHVAWLLEPESPPIGGVVFYHGANRAGSHQYAAFPIQRGLLAAGYTVLSVDHLGYGETPTPNQEQTLEAWNPITTARAANDFLDKTLASNIPRIVIGHSMGTSEVLRLLGTEIRPDLAVIAAGSAPDPPKNNDYWYERFHYDRSMKWQLTKEDWKYIHNYYDNRKLAANVRPNHTPILFVDFEIEWPNVRIQREPLWDALPMPRMRVELPETTHYLNSFEKNKLIFFCNRAARNFSRVVDEARNQYLSQ